MLTVSRSMYRSSKIEATYITSKYVRKLIGCVYQGLIFLAVVKLITLYSLNYD